MLSQSRMEDRQWPATPRLTKKTSKWRHQPAARSRSWSATIDEQRLQVEGVFAESPSLRPTVSAALPPAYLIARNRAIAETGLADEVFPEARPFTPDEVLSRKFFPDP